MKLLVVVVWENRRAAFQGERPLKAVSYTIILVVACATITCTRIRARGEIELRDLFF